MLNTKISLLALLFGVWSPALLAQDAETVQENGKKQSIFDLLHYQEVLKVELETDLNQLQLNRKNEDYQPAVFTFEDRQGKRQHLDIELRVRGRFRRRVCNFPPIKLKFDKDELKEKNLKKHNELKLVTHCLNDREGKELILREYLIYQLFERLSPVHYRSQLVRIKYNDPVRKMKVNNYGIILEDENELAARYDTDLCEDCFNVDSSKFDQENLNVLALFEFMIGNTDWSVPLLRNLKVLRGEKKEIYYAVPYDFDFSGLVNASYAIPDPTYDLASVRERYYLGNARTEAELETTKNIFRDKRGELFKVVSDFTLLGRSSRSDIKEYLRQFYVLLEKGRIKG